MKIQKNVKSLFWDSKGSDKGSEPFHKQTLSYKLTRSKKGFAAKSSMVCFFSWPYQLIY